MSHSPSMFSLRIVSIDHYMTSPQHGQDICYSSFNGESIKSVPVVRIFGSTPVGQRCCLHLHKTFPYFFVRIPESEALHQIDDFLRKLSVSIERAVKVSFGNRGTKEVQFVHSICLVKGKPFYGFYACPMLFLRVFIYNPKHLTRIVNLLRSGGIMGRVFEIYESHIPYLLQVCIDYGLYGMNFIHASSVQFRCPLPDKMKRKALKISYSPSCGVFDTQRTDTRVWITATVPPSCINNRRKQSHCELEADLFAEDITNIADSHATPPLSSDARYDMIVKSLASMWDEERKRRKENNNVSLDPTPEDSAQEILQNENWAAHTPCSLESHHHSKLEKLLKLDAIRYQAALQTEIEATSTTPSQFDSALASPSNMTYDKIAKHPETISARSQYEPMVDEHVIALSQHSDLETFYILNDMDGDDGGEDLKNSQQEIKDILESSLAFHESESDILFPDLRSPPTSPSPMDVDSKEIIPYPIEDIEQLVNQSQRNLPLSSSPRLLPQYDGALDEFLVPKRKYRKKNNSKRFCSLFEDTFIPQYEPPPPPSCNPIPPPLMVRKKRRKRPKSKDRPKQAPLPSSRIRPIITSLELRPPMSSHLPLPSSVVCQPEEIHILLSPPDPPPPLPRPLLPVSIPSIDLLPPPLPRPQAISPPLMRESVFVPFQPPAIPSKRKAHHTVLPLTMWSPAEGRNDFFEPNTSPRSRTPHILSDHLPMSTGIYMDDSKGREASPGSALSPISIPVTHKQLTSPHPLPTPSPILPSPITSLEASLDPFFHEDLSLELSVTPPSPYRALRLLQSPPTRLEAMNTFTSYGLPTSTYQEPFYSKEEDRPRKPFTFAGKTFPIPLQDHTTLPPFHPILQNLKETTSLPGLEYWKLLLAPPPQIRSPFTLIKKPPCRKEVERWLERKEGSAEELNFDPSQLDGPTPPKGKEYGFAHTQYKNEEGIPRMIQHLKSVAIELHVNTRGDFQPNPLLDSIQFITLYMQEDHKTEFSLGSCIIFLVEDCEFGAPRSGYLTRTPFASHIIRVPNENILFDRLVEWMRQTDPDILLGYEVQSSSLGFLIERAATFHRNLASELSRIDEEKTTNKKQEDTWGMAHATGISITGRIILNVWRILRSEITSNRYSFENMVYHILHKRQAYYSCKDVTRWFQGNSISSYWDAVKYYCDKVMLTSEMLDQLDIIGRTSELARLYGIDFYSVLSRGSQYRVESMTLRLTRPQNYVLLSPGREQVRRMRAPECLPLVMEPESAFYTNPVLVLDFQSLYPSIIIAYNYCYSTCLGKVSDDLSKPFGVTNLQLPPGMLSLLGMKNLTLTPNEVLFAKPEVRKGILPRLLQEILNTRVMVKNAMKEVKGKNPALYKQLDARQYGLKMIANVTYGYTSASFSGRMPCVDIADAIVQTARETLERAIRQVEKKWKGARVVYGDTDSLFVELPGLSKAQAFHVGKEIAKEITESNPHPVKLKFEKVYLPCLLVSKKRYVGYMYEHEGQEEAIFDAKGIETVRRDSCPLVAKMMEKSIRLLFEKKNLSIIKSYLYKQWQKIMQERVGLQEFIFAKEVRLGTYSTKGIPPPAALVCMKRMAKDPRAEPQYGERIPYVVVSGALQSRLADLVVDPLCLVDSSEYRIHAAYYITKQIIPALSRLFCLVGVDIKLWYMDMPKKQSLAILPPRALCDKKEKKSRIEHYYATRKCPVCKQLTDVGICASCAGQPQYASFVLTEKLRHLQEIKQKMVQLCMHCSSVRDEEELLCRSLDCPVFFERKKYERTVFDMNGFWDVLNQL